MQEIHYLIGNACNLNCDFCFWDVRMPDVSLEFKKKIINQIVDSGIKTVTLSGGEPLCASNFLDVLEYMNNKGLEIVLHSNGLKINKKIAEKIAPLVSRVSLTMDAVSADAQIRMRKNNEITGHTIELIKIFSELNVPVNIKTLVTKINEGEITKIGQVLQSLPIKYWSLLEFNPINRGKINQSAFLLDQGGFNKICAKTKSEFGGLDIKTRRFTEAKNEYCFIAPNGDVYAYKKGEGDILVGSLKSEGLASIISKIEN